MPARVLIACYSLSGNTEGLARDLAAAMEPGSWEFELLHEPRPRKGWRGIVRCIGDSIARRAPPIVTPLFRPRNFDVVLVGTPVWMGRISAPARTYLVTEQFASARVGVFVTSGGPLNAATRADIEAACARKPVEILQFRTREVHDVAKLDAFLRAMGVAVRGESPPAPKVLPATGAHA